MAKIITQVKDMARYVAAYASGYRGDAADAAAWQAARRARILGKSNITVTVSESSVVTGAGKHPTVTFTQGYRADAVNLVNRKTLEFEQERGRWVIRRELAGRSGA